MAKASKQKKINKSTLTGVIYARYSPGSRQKEESIEQQVEECMLFAQANDIEVIHVYSDKKITGKTDKRANFQKMMRAAEKKEFDVVVAYKSSRIARNMLHAMIHESKLEELGIKTLYAKEEFGNTAAGRFALRTMMNVNQFYSENLREDVLRGMMDNAKNCKVNGVLPLGYKKGEDGKYAIDEHGAAIVKEIYRRILAGEELIEIRNDLNSRGIKTKSGSLWNKNSFHRILTNDTYIGVYRFRGVVVEGGVPPIISREDFEAVQDWLLTKKKPIGRKRENGDYYLTGKLYCGYCSSFMVGISGTSRSGILHYYYICKERRDSGNCKKTNVKRDWIEQQVAELTQQFILRDDVIEWIADSAVRFHAEAHKDSEISTLEDELEENKKAAKNIVAAIEQGIITAATKDRLLELELDISNLERIIRLAKIDDKPLDREQIVFFLRKMRDGSPESKAYQKKLIDTFVKAIYLRDDDIRIDYYYAGKKNSITKDFSYYEGSEAEGENGNGECGSVRLSSPSPHQDEPS